MPDVANKLDSWFTNPADGSGNLPTGATTIGTGMDDNLRQIQAVVRTLVSENTIAAAGTTDLSTVNDTHISVTGNTTIVGFGTLTAGMTKWLTFAGTPMLKNSTAIGCIGAADITAAAGDVAVMESKGSGNWTMKAYSQANVGPSSFKIGSFTRDTSLASGSQSVTGAGFKPRLVIFLSGSASGAVGATSIGFDTVTNNGVLYHTTAADTWATQASASILAVEGAGVNYSGTLASMDTDGFTITWTKTGATAGTITVPYLAFR